MATQLSNLLTAVKEKNLNKEQLEDFYSQMIHLNTQILIERAELRKKEAFFFMDSKQVDPNESDTSIKRRWRVTSEGQRLLELEAYKSALPKELDSIKTRIYSFL